MKNKIIYSCIFSLLCFQLKAQTLFDKNIQIPSGYFPTEFVMPPSPLTTQVLFIGGVDFVQTTNTYGNPAGETVAKEGHDFIGITPDESGQSLGWVSINHEKISKDDMIGDGGGMTVFKIKRAADGTLEILDQTLSDGRSGKFFNVDFVNTTGETGMNCGGICSMVDGRIWTGEEWFRDRNLFIYNNGTGVRDTSDFTITNSGIPGWDGLTLKKFENFNWMTEIDPKEAKAIRKQYNWGRQAFEGGAIAPDNRLVYLGTDETPGFFSMFVANTPGDFTRGTLFVYKHDKPGWKWVPIWEDGSMLNYKEVIVEKGATMFNRIEWITIDPKDNFVYFSATGLDNPASIWIDEAYDGAVFHPATIARAKEQGIGLPTHPVYRDFYGRIWKYNPMTSEISVYLEGGPLFFSNPTEANYPEKHLSNPDGLSVMQIDGRSFLVIQEDLNGTSFGRVPAGVANRLCELYLLDLTIEEPTLDDLIRLTAVPAGAEITGAIQTPDGNSLLINSQHPRTTNPFPYNHALTIAIHGFNDISIDDDSFGNPFDGLQLRETATPTEAFSVYPNPTTRTIFINKVTDIALYDVNGKRVKVARNTSEVDVSDLPAGSYYLQNTEGEILKLVIQ